MVGAVTLVAFFGVWAEVHYDPSTVTSPIGAFTLTLGVAAPLLIRRQLPIAAATLTLAMCYLYRALGYPGFAPAIVVFLLCYTLANVKGLVYGLVPAFVAWIIPSLPPHSLSLVNSAVAMPPVGMAVAALIGEANRRRRLDYEARVRESAATAEERLGRRMAEERLRIARELHDVLAHTISIVAVQSSVALDALEDDPQEARTALLAVRGAAKQAMPELRAALDMLRDSGSSNGSGGAEDDGDGVGGDGVGVGVGTDGGSGEAGWGAAGRVGVSARTVPQPGFHELPDLIRLACDSGLAVEFTVEGQIEEASPLLQLTSYRIVQEALTNVRKHAEATTAQVKLQRSRDVLDSDVLDIDVLDDGRGLNSRGAGSRLGSSAGSGLGGGPGGGPGGGAGSAHGSGRGSGSTLEASAHEAFGHGAERPGGSAAPGFGLLGMRERAESLGGELATGPRENGGYFVHARLPWTAGSSAAPSAAPNGAA
jgi:signal transduction histidine kinase